MSGHFHPKMRHCFFQLFNIGQSEGVQNPLRMALVHQQESGQHLLRHIRWLELEVLGGWEALLEVGVGAVDGGSDVVHW